MHRGSEAIQSGQSIYGSKVCAGCKNQWWNFQFSHSTKREDGGRSDCTYVKIFFELTLVAHVQWFESSPDAFFRVAPCAVRRNVRRFARGTAGTSLGNRMKQCASRGLHNASNKTSMKNENKTLKPWFGETQTLNSARHETPSSVAEEAPAGVGAKRRAPKKHTLEIYTALQVAPV